jgi:tRNA-2-methylthio-N6-dimethylallyladenosine synthase
MKSFYIETFGCQMNVHDSEKVIGTLMERGYNQVEAAEGADLVLFNTCSIRDKAEQKVFNRLMHHKKGGAKQVVGLLGCVAQQEGERVFERAPHVSLVVGSASYTKLPELLVRIEQGERRVTGLSLDTEETFDTPLTRRDTPFRAFLTIIEGCDKSCAYCVVPYTRGPERSRTMTSVLDEVKKLVDNGYTEVTLLGQNVNSYRDPSPGGAGFAQLFAAVGEVPGIRRVRFTTSHPRDFTKEIIDAIDAVPALCNHVHLPVQSGSDRILEAMQRQYTIEQYMQRISWMKNARRKIAITTDLIVGFPGETEKEFQETLALMDTVGYDGIFSFKYSPRPNTPALHMIDAVPEEEKGRRLMRLVEHQRTILIRNNAAYVGSVEEVHVEHFNIATGQWVGKSTQHKTVNFTHPEGQTARLEGTYLDVLVTRSGVASLVGEAVEELVCAG